jgi:hypothetical protein
MIQLARSYYGDKKEELSFYHIKDTFNGIEDESIDAAMANWVYVTCDSLDTIRQSFREFQSRISPVNDFHVNALDPSLADISVSILYQSGQ